MIKTLRIPLLTILLCGSIFLIACNEDVLATVDPGVQLALDLKIIEEYLQTNSYTQVDTTTLGVRYVILEEGNGADIVTNDIVSFHIIGRLTDDVVWATTLASVAKDNDIYDSLAFYSPLVISYTPDGWNISELVNGFGSLETGYRSGVAAVLGKMNVGGHAKIIIPSSRAYAANPPFGFGLPANAVLVFDIYPSFKR